MSSSEPINIVHGLLLGNIPGLAAHHNTELHLPVQLVSDRRQRQVRGGAHHTGGELVKHQWLSGNGNTLLLTVVLVVHTNTENLTMALIILNKLN